MLIFEVMEAELKEFSGGNGNIEMAVIWVTEDLRDIVLMNKAKKRLNEFIRNYVGKKKHEVYMHTNEDTMSATILFEVNDGRTIQI